MNLALIVKRPAPASGTYRDWKPALAVEGEHRCVYCGIHEASFGGYRNFHVEHLRPRKRYPRLTNAYTNLFYACGICNSFKGDDWPATNRLAANIVCYPDPSTTDYSTLTEVRVDTGIAAGLTKAGRYIVERLCLNRPQLLMERRAFHVRSALNAEMRELRALVARGVSGSQEHLMSELVLTLIRTAELLVQYSRVRPYSPADVQR